ncbi:hypothetical protein ACXR6G_17885 [Ancylomarina sp. YFZ004]
MDIKEYRFLEASWILVISVFISTMILNAFVAFKIQETYELSNGPISGIAIVIYILLVPVLVSRILAFSKTTIRINKREIHVYRSSMIGLPIKSNFKLHYSQIKEYVFQEDLNWYWLKLVDVSNNKYRIWKLELFNNKEYKNFRDRLNNEIRWYNEETKNSKNIDSTTYMIEVASNIYQGNVGLILGLISLITLIVIPIILIMFEVKNLSSIAPILIGLSGAGYTLIKVKNERSKK